METTLPPSSTHRPSRAWWFLVFVWLVLYGRLVLGWCPSGGDIINQYLPYQQLIKTAIHSGELPLYNAMTFCGRPLMADIQTGVLYPPNWLHWILPLPISFALVVALHGAFMLWGCWKFGRALELDDAAIVLAATLFTASPFFLLKNNSGVVLFLYAAAWWPWLAWGFLRRRWLLLPWLFALSLLTGSPQITFYGWIAVFLLAFFWPAESTRARARSFGLLCLCFAAGLGLTAIQTAQTAGFIGHSFERGGAGGAGWDYITDGSFAPRLFWLLLNPGFLGDYTHQDELYWGKPPDFAEACYYLPIWVLGMLVPLALLLTRWRAGDDLHLRRRRTLALLGLAGLLIAPALAMGKYSPLFALAYHIVPAFNKFRVPARMMIWETCSAALLAALAIDHLQRCALESIRRRFNSILLPCAILCSAALAANWLFRSSFWQASGSPAFGGGAPENVFNQFKSIATQHTLIGLVGVLAVVGVLALSDKRLAKNVGLLLPLLALAELVWLAHTYQTLTPYSQYQTANYPETNLVQILKRETHGGRVLWLDDVISWQVDQNQPEIYPNRLPMYGLADTRGYDPVNARWIGEWMNLLAGIPPEKNPHGFMFVPRIARPAWLTLMGVELVLSYNDLTNFPGLHAVAKLPFPEGNLGIYRNDRFKGMAFAAPLPHIAHDDAEARYASAKIADDPKADPLAAIVTTPDLVNDALAATHAIDARYKIHPLPPGNHTFRYQADYPSAALLCFAQSAWPAWQATIDGNPAPWSALSGTFVAVNVPAGRHEIVFDFVPEGYATGKLISLLALAGVLYMTARCLMLRRKQA